jgi:dipeptidase E
MSHPRIVETVVKMTGICRPKLVYLGTATYDKDEPYHIQTDGYSHQCQVIKLDVSEAVERIPSTAEIQETLESANIVMVGGGNTLYAMNRWKALGMDETLKRIATQGVVLCGGSAGAICWFEHGHSDSMDPTTFLNVDPNLTEEQKKDWEYIR